MLQSIVPICTKKDAGQFCRSTCLAFAILILFLIVPGAYAAHVTNPYSGATQYVNPDYATEVNTAIAAQTSGSTLAKQMAVVETYPTAIWLDKIAAINGGTANGGRMSLQQHITAALAQQAASGTGEPIVMTLVIYDLPDRDCAALASNGELSIAGGDTPIGSTTPLTGTGIEEYETDFIDPIYTILNQYASNGNIRFVLIIEDDSLPNMITNTGLSYSLANCVAANDGENYPNLSMNGVYVKGIQYALNKFHSIGNVYNYLDVGHHGWLGWPVNMNAAVPFFYDVASGTTAGVSSVDGFITNTANYGPTVEPYMTATESIGGSEVYSSTFYQYDPYIDEESYAAAFDTKLIAAGFPSTLGFLIDTSRNGWGGTDRPTAASTSTVLDTFVDASKIDQRDDMGQWCNQPNAGLGMPPTVNPGYFANLQAYVWVKPPGESDGNYPGSVYNGVTSTAGDANCNPTHQNSLANNMVTNALANSPSAGTFWLEEFTMLVENAYPAISASTASSYTVSASSVSVEQGTSASSSVTVSALNGFDSAVSLSVSGLPAGVTASFSPSSVTGSAGSTLTFTASSTATVGSASVTVTGTSGTTVETATLILTVTAAPNFTLAASPTSVTVAGGSTASSQVTITYVGGLTGSVALTASNVPSGVSANFSPSSVNASGTASVSFYAQTGTAVGTTNVTITGTDGSIAQSAVIALTVTSTATATPAIASINPVSGVVGTSVTITGSNFGSSQGTSTVTFGGTDATVTSWSNNSIIATVPTSLSAGVVSVIVSVGSTNSNSESFTVTSATCSATSTLGAGYWHTSGNKILDSNGNQVRIAGINWYGFETTDYLAHGLWAQDYKTVLNTIKSLGYNVIRIPFSNELVESNPIPTNFTQNANGVDANTALVGQHALTDLDTIVSYAGSIGLRVILDNHISEAGNNNEASGLWYTSAYPQANWIADWQTMATRYSDSKFTFNGNPTVIGFDLRNEPHSPTSGGSCWTGDTAAPSSCPATLTTQNWPVAATAAGNAVLAINPKLLIFVEGVDCYDGTCGWQGGNLMGVASNPITLNTANQLVYSAHDYGPNLYEQSWFNSSTTAASLQSIWSKYWGYISTNGTAPVWLGEFGTDNTSTDIENTTAGSQGQWFETMVSYLTSNTAINWTNWALNGEDSYALLDSNYDATPVSSLKQSLLASIQFPLGSTTTSSSSGFTLAPATSTLSVTQGSSATDTVTVTDDCSFSGSVTLSASNLPSGVTASFGTNPTTGSSVVTFAASSSAVAGTTTVTITGTSGSLTASTTVALTVSAAGSFTLAPTASTLSVTQGSSATDTVTVADVNGFSGSVTLAASNLPSGVTASFGTNPTTSSSVVIFAASSSASAGTTTVTISGTSGSLTSSTTIALTVSAAGSFTLAPAASTLSVTQGSSASDTVTVTDVNSFSGSVTLAATNLPAGVTASFGTNPTTGSSVVTFAASSSATAGTTTVTISGTSGSLTASTTIALTVSAAGSFTLAPTSSSVSVTQGSSATDTVTVTDANGFSGSVTLSATNLPSGVTASFGTNPTTGSSVVTFAASSSASAGTTTVTISGTSGSLTASTTIALTIAASRIDTPGFTISGTPVTVPAGATTGNTSTITVTPANGFTGNVTLTAEITSSPSGAQDPPTLSFGTTSPVSITGTASGTGTLTITTTAFSVTATLADARRKGIPGRLAGGISLACLLLVGIPKRRRKWRAFLGMVLLFGICCGGMMGCGVNFKEDGTTKGSYTVTVTGTSGSTSTTNTFTLVVE
jgi:endoglucanase